MNAGQLRKLMAQCSMDHYVITESALALAAAIEAAERERSRAEFDLVLARQKIAYEREIEIDVAAEREWCAKVVLNAAKHGCCCSDSEALAAVIRVAERRSHRPKVRWTAGLGPVTGD